GRGVARDMRRRLPHDPTGRPIERRPGGADVVDDEFAVDERRTGEAPPGGLGARLPGQILAPDLGARGGVQAECLAFATERVEAVSFHRRRGAGSALIAGRAGIAEPPEGPAGSGVETVDGILPSGIAHRVEAAVLHGDRRIPFADLRRPEPRW